MTSETCSMSIPSFFFLFQDQTRLYCAVFFIGSLRLLIFQTFEFFFRLKTWKNLRALSSCTSQTTASKFWRIWRRTAAWPPSIWPPTGSASSTISSPCKMLKSSGSTTTWYLLVVAYWLIWLCVFKILGKSQVLFLLQNAMLSYSSFYLGGRLVRDWQAGAHEEPGNSLLREEPHSNAEPGGLPQKTQTCSPQPLPDRCHSLPIEEQKKITNNRYCYVVQRSQKINLQFS